jgi:phage baseplate assembly protein W
MADTTEYGSDADWGPRGPTSPMIPWVTGVESVALCLSRLLSIPTGSLEYWPNTVALCQFVESNASNQTIKEAVERVVRGQERIADSLVTVDRDAEGTVLVKVIGRLASGGTFALVMSATAAASSIELLRETP